ncbi:MAG: tetratricopeptide repeat protein [Bacteroidia bacterium]|nr:tetratricopeptide repeat protein [Bacteroidia bacterium]
MLRRTLLFILLIPAILQSQNVFVDSLEKVLKHAKDSQRVVILSLLTAELSTQNPTKAEMYSAESYGLAKKLNIPSLIIKSAISRGTIMNIRADHAGALQVMLDALKVAEKYNDKSGIVSCLSAAGYCYHRMSDWKTSLQFFHKALVYKDYADKRTLGNLYNNIGNSLFYLKELDSARYYHEKALDIRTLNNDMRGISYSLNNIGLIHNDKKEYDQAIDFFIRSLVIKEKIGEKKGIASGNINIADVYRNQGKFEKAVKYAEKGIQYADEVGALDFLISGYDVAARSCEGLGNHKKASEYLHKLILLKDSLVNMNSAKKMAEMKAQYESEKQQEQIALKEELIQTQDHKISQQKLFIWIASLGVFTLLALVFFNYRNYRKKQELFNKLAQSNEVIERKNKDITDSIRYALRIQNAILPDQRVLGSQMPDHFIYYNPRDIVSGDFYWFHHFGPVTLLASADCTGHGVPGAFMSMICVQLLNQTVGDTNITSPEQALGVLDSGVKKALSQSGLDESSDGMDIALCAIHTDKMRLQYAGAFRPLYLVRNGEFYEYKANKFSIGGHVDRSKSFKGHEINLQKGDCIYMFTDGYADQFGGQEGKKFMMRNFKKLIKEIWSRPMQEQHRILHETFSNWKGTFDQVDDVLVLGVRI